MIEHPLDAQILVYLKGTDRARTLPDILRALHDLPGSEEDVHQALARLERQGQVERQTDDAAGGEESWRARDPLPR